MNKKSILVVDDEEDILELVRFNLDREGFSVICAATGEEAWRVLMAKPVDLVVLDLMLPGMDGLELTRRMKKDAKKSLVPIMMLTAKGEEADIVAGLELGADDYVTKPFSPRVLVARVRALFRRYSQPAASENEMIKVEALEIHTGRRSVTVNAQLYGVSSAGLPVPPAGLGFYAHPNRRCRAGRRLPCHGSKRGCPNRRIAQKARGLRQAY